MGVKETMQNVAGTETHTLELCVNVGIQAVLAALCLHVKINQVSIYIIDSLLFISKKPCKVKTFALSLKTFLSFQAMIQFVKLFARGNQRSDTKLNGRKKPEGSGTKKN